MELGNGNSMKGIKKHSLDFNKTISYFVDHISNERMLSKRIIETIDFHQGIFFTLLPFNAELDRLYEFSYGGIIPAIPYGTELYDIKGCQEAFHPQKVVTMDHALSAFIATYAKLKPQNCAIVENFMLEPNDFHANIKNVIMVNIKNEVYYFLNKKNSTDQIYETIIKSSQVWHFLAVLTMMEGMVPISFNHKDIDQICNNSKFVVASAYDGESYILWEKIRQTAI